MQNLDPERVLPLVLSIAAGVLTSATAWGQATATATQSIQGEIDPAGKLSVPATLTLTSAGGPTFPSFTGSATVSYRARTTPTGSGAITAQVTSNFSPTGGPSASAGDLTYTCSGSTLGTNCSGTQTASTASATPVLTIPSSACTGGGGSCSASDPNTMQVNFTLTNRVTYKTGTFSAQVTFSISAT